MLLSTNCELCDLNVLGGKRRVFVLLCFWILKLLCFIGGMSLIR